MSGWLKLFVDGTKEDGNDIAIEQKKASWSRGRLDEIKEVRLFNHLRTCSLAVPQTNWHQFDRFIVPVSEGVHKPYRTHQVVQAEIQQQHLGMHLVCSRTGQNFFWAVLKDYRQEALFTKEIAKANLGKWITVILPVKDYPAVNFSTRGKMNDNKQIPK